jgi:hypothetical protein
VNADSVLLPGGLVSESDPSPNSNVLIDPDAHANDRASLVALGVVDVPAGDIGPLSFGEIPGASEALGAVAPRMPPPLQGDSRTTPHLGAYLEPETLSMPRAYGLLAELTGASKARFTFQLIGRLAEPGSKDPFDLATAPGASTPEDRRASPAALVRAQTWRSADGHFHSTPQGTCRAAPVSLATPAGLESHRIRARSTEHRVPDRVGYAGDLCAFWGAMIAALVTPAALNGDALTDLWLGAAKDGVVPTELPSRRAAFR